MPKEQIASRVDDTTKREVEEYADEHDITQSEAIRVLLARGIDYERGRLRSAADSADTDEEEESGGGTGLERVAERLPSFAYLLAALTALLWTPLLLGNTFSAPTVAALLTGVATLLASTFAMVISVAALLAVNRPVADVLPAPLRQRVGRAD